jgi:hypothetical protein
MLTRVVGLTFGVVFSVLAAQTAHSDECQRDALIPLDCAEGQELLRSASPGEDFTALIRYFTTQDSLKFCGVASASMVLNALPLERPGLVGRAPFRLFDQSNVFSEGTAMALKAEDVARTGMTLDQLAAFLRAYPTTVEVVYASDLDLNSFRKRTNHALRAIDTYVVANYDRQVLGQVGEGHISPLAAYHEESDRYLILDVARYRYPPVWVKASRLRAAARAIDVDSNRSRGLVIVSRRAGQ